MKRRGDKMRDKEFRQIPTIYDFKCRECGSNDIEYRDLSDIYEDEEYHCKGCNRYWIVEGSDY